MEYQVLARKFRPQNFEEMVGQDHIRSILQNAIIHNNIAHAYLFSGTRGVGKTTAARIFAKAIMCGNRDEKGNPCLKCDSCQQVNAGSSLDYLEIDGASNNSVENVRELIDNVQYLPTNGKYKVYVIDEVHMLSTSAFNALLKTLEEPPAHVVFIFATTDPHKLLDTVISRCQRIEFKNLNPDELKSLVRGIAQKEGIKFESEDVVEALCDHGNGSGRDVLSVLELLKNVTADKYITNASLANVLGIPEKSSIIAFIKSIIQADIAQTQKLFESIINSPVDLVKFHLQLQKNFFKLIEGVALNQVDSEYSSIDFSQYSLAELMWIYEVMSKDFEWIESSTMIEQNLKILYIKLTLRKQILSSEKSGNVEVKKKENLAPETETGPIKANDESSDDGANIIQAAIHQLEQQKEDVVEPETSAQESSFAEVEEELAEELPRSSEFYFQDFIEDLFQTHSTLAVNLERGNLLEDAIIQNGHLSLVIGFSEAEKVFYDVMSEPESKNKLKEVLLSTYEIHEDGLNIQIRLLTDTEINNKNFKSKVEIDEQNLLQAKEEQKDRLLNNVFIKNAEQIFESKVNKIILND